ncbi:hypothetical protein PMAYCL1PPCAC_18369 [Pristionchus mayeri]|uniref:Phosphatidylinositol-3,4,5-trisphosphate 3-phosphatase n=1 Tax=Pristionchus mayeri TaxID=1317129 RepID=A0AAN5CPS0_9BILA|nr:hypothetical protein PMAYCL1PPCAC_18369 [Pristionchus mayeri]
MKHLSSVDVRPTHPSTMSASSIEGASSSAGSAEMQGDQLTREDRPIPPHQSVPASASDLICNPLRTMVSQNRRRYHDDGFNLDLTYITDRIIAMGYPADTKEALYRNSMESTVQFLEYYHKGHYKVFNLRGQYVYDTKKFHDRVLSFEMVDHHPPRLEMMAPFCREVHDYLNADPRNIVAVHCKAGKGRTGVMICAYLCYISFYKLPRQNMDYYSIVRTHNNKGVTIPSQRRYVYYFSHLRKKELNYIPLRCELVGIFLERPPKQSSFPVKKGLEVRVVNGDVTVFEGKPICLSKEEWEDEERVWERGVSRGEDSYDEKSGSGNCLSRRAYGWEVPEDKRVFLEGDVRLEILSVKPLKNKIGHCWFNTMFTCQIFCGGAYIHGDEAFPYPPGGTTISEGSSVNEQSKSGSASLPSSPPSTPKMGSGSLSGRRAPSFDARKTSRTPRFSNVMKKFADGVSYRNSSDASMSEKEDKKGRQTRNDTNTDRQLVATPFTLVSPPGLDAHCPESSLKLIYGNSERKPPRELIEKMVMHAHTHNMVNDSYNERRLSVPQQGPPVEKAPEGRPTAAGPNAIMRRDDEHVTVFSVLEMDKACKNKELDAGFKMIVVTRCLSDKESDLRLADKFLEVTREKQAQRDEKKREKVEARQRRLQSGGGRGSDEGADNVCARRKEGEDPRQEDPFLKKYFYRQRADSVSRYPSHNHRCPLVKYSLPPGGILCGTRDSPVDNSPSTSYGRVCEENNGEERGDFGKADWIEGADHLDHDVRSYHPEDQKWQSCASSTTVSSESDPPPGEQEDDPVIVHSPSHSPSPSPIPTPMPS